MNLKFQIECVIIIMMIIINIVEKNLDDDHLFHIETHRVFFLFLLVLIVFRLYFVLFRVQFEQAKFKQPFDCLAFGFERWKMMTIHIHSVSWAAASFFSLVMMIYVWFGKICIKLLLFYKFWLFKSFFSLFFTWNIFLITIFLKVKKNFIRLHAFFAFFHTHTHIDYDD